MAMQTWREWLKQQQEASTMRVEDVPIGTTPGWQQSGGAFRNLNKEGAAQFFRVVGIKITKAAREVLSWGQPGLREVVDESDPKRHKRSGFVCHIVCQPLPSQPSDPSRWTHILVQAMEEPFNPARGCVSLAPAIQTSATKRRLHADKIPFGHLLDESTGMGDTAKDPGRTDGINALGVLEVLTLEEVGELPTNFRWFTRDELIQASNANALGEFDDAPFNGHFWTALGCYTVSSS